MILRLGTGDKGLAASRHTQGVERQKQRQSVLSLLSEGTGSEMAVGGTERPQMTFFGSESDDWQSNEVN